MRQYILYNSISKKLKGGQNSPMRIAKTIPRENFYWRPGKRMTGKRTRDFREVANILYQEKQTTVPEPHPATVGFCKVSLRHSHSDAFRYYFWVLSRHTGRAE